MSAVNKLLVQSNEMAKTKNFAQPCSPLLGEEEDEFDSSWDHCHTTNSSGSSSVPNTPAVPTPATNFLLPALANKKQEFPLVTHNVTKPSLADEVEKESNGLADETQTRQSATDKNVPVVSHDADGRHRNALNSVKGEKLTALPRDGANEDESHIVLRAPLFVLSG